VLFITARRIASAVLVTAIPSVCPSVRPSHAGIVSKRRHVARCSLHCRIAKCVSFCRNQKNISQGRPPPPEILAPSDLPAPEGSEFWHSLPCSASTVRDTTRRPASLTGQRAANFRLLANQWAECRLVTQWRHGCRAMRRSVCNASPSNAGRSLCVQISRERATPGNIYNSKGNWLRYNAAADSLYIMKICSRLFVRYCVNCPKHDKLRCFIYILKKLRAA